jgi:hypothetical protein
MQVDRSIGERLAVGSDAVEEHRQIAAVEVGLHMPARAVDQRLEQRGDPVACLVGALRPKVGIVDDVGQAPVFGLEPQDPAASSPPCAPGAGA